MTTAEEFMAATPALPGSNTAWGQRLADEIKATIRHTASQAPRSLQKRLGPSELGSICDYQIVGKLIGTPTTNHVSDPWPAIIGTAVHAWLATAFDSENERLGFIQWLTELAVVPMPGHGGHTDLYKVDDAAVIDWKILGPTSLARIRTGIPPRKYLVQLLLYGIGCLNAGLPVRHVVIAALPRTASTLDNAYIWDHPFGGEDDIRLLLEVFRVTEIRKQIAEQILAGRMSLEHVPITPDDTECFFCPYYRPQAAYDGGPGCPGTIGNRP